MANIFLRKTKGIQSRFQSVPLHMILHIWYPQNKTRKALNILPRRQRQTSFNENVNASLLSNAIVSDLIFGENLLWNVLTQDCKCLARF